MSNSTSILIFRALSLLGFEPQFLIQKLTFSTIESMSNGNYVPKFKKKLYQIYETYVQN